MRRFAAPLIGLENPPGPRAFRWHFDILPRIEHQSITHAGEPLPLLFFLSPLGIEQVIDHLCFVAVERSGSAS